MHRSPLSQRKSKAPEPGEEIERRAAVADRCGDFPDQDALGRSTRLQKSAGRDRDRDPRPHHANRAPLDHRHLAGAGTTHGTRQIVLDGKGGQGFERGKCRGISRLDQ